MKKFEVGQVWKDRSGSFVIITKVDRRKPRSHRAITGNVYENRKLGGWATWHLDGEFSKEFGMKHADLVRQVKRPKWL